MKNTTTIGKLPESSSEMRAYRPKSAQKMLDISESYFWDQVAKGRLKTIKISPKVTLVTSEAINNWIALCEADMSAKLGPVPCRRKAGAA